MKISKHAYRIVAAGLLTACLSAPAEAGRTLIFTDGSPNRGTRAEATMWFADQLEKRTNGELKIEFHWGGALLKAKAAAKGIGAGAADMGFVLGVYNPKIHHGFTIGDLPTKFSDPWVGTRAMYDLAHSNKDIMQEFDKLNLHYITNVSSTEIQLICKDKAVKSIDDIKGLKVRGISVYGKVFKDLGANPVRMSVYKAYQGLDTGLIDCTQIYSYAIPAFKLQEVAKEVTVLDWGALMGLAYVINKDTYNSLSPKHQKILTQLGSDFIDYYAEKATVGNINAIKGLKAASDGNAVNIHKFTDAEKAKLLSASGSYLDDWKTKATSLGMDAGGLIDQYHVLLKKYDDERQTKGHPWTR